MKSTQYVQFWENGCNGGVPIIRLGASGEQRNV